MFVFISIYTFARIYMHTLSSLFPFLLFYKLSLECEQQTQPTQPSRLAATTKEEEKKKTE